MQRVNNQSQIGAAFIETLILTTLILTITIGALEVSNLYLRRKEISNLVNETVSSIVTACLLPGELTAPSAIAAASYMDCLTRNRDELTDLMNRSMSSFAQTGSLDIRIVFLPSDIPGGNPIEVTLSPTLGTHTNPIIWRRLKANSVNVIEVLNFSKRLVIGEGIYRNVPIMGSWLSPIFATNLHEVSAQ